MVSQRIRDTRVEQKISQKELASKLFVSPQAVSKWERDEATPNPEALAKMAEIFGVSADYLLGRTDQKETRSPAISQEIAMDDFIYAMQNETKDLTDMDKQILLSMAKQLNQARRQNGETG